MDPEPEEQFEVNPDHQCSICLNVFYLPLRINVCGHSFCKPCINAISQKNAQPKCPLCRKDFNDKNIEPNSELREDVENWYPLQIEQRAKKQQKINQCKFIVGNTAKKVQKPGCNQDFYEWVFYLQLVGGGNLHDYAQQIQVHLHPTFKKSVIKFKGNQSIRVCRKGWGVFKIQILIFWKKELKAEHSRFEHMLSWAPHTYKKYSYKL